METDSGSVSLGSNPSLAATPKSLHLQHKHVGGTLLLARCPSTQPLGQEPLPPPAAHGLLGSQVGAGPEHAGGLARQPDRHDQPTPMTGPKVAAEQVGRAVHSRPTYVGHPARRLAESELDEPGRHLVGGGWRSARRHERGPGLLETPALFSKRVRLLTHPYNYA